MDPLELPAIGAIIVFAWMTVLWLLQWRWRDASVVDVGWSASLGILACLYAAAGAFVLSRSLIVAGLASLWSFRLASYLLVNRVIGKSEDGRYQSLRERWGNRANGYFFLFFQLQAILAVVFSLPVLTAMSNPAPFGSALDLVGVAVWVFAVVGEIVADAQLARFRREPTNRGKVCQQGLWRYSRHPNYFFEWLHWWTYVFFAFGSAHWPITLLGPVLMLLFLIFVTGIPATEAHALASRGEAYRQYQRTTSAFFPWFPRKEET